MTAIQSLLGSAALGLMLAGCSSTYEVDARDADAASGGGASASGGTPGAASGGATSSVDLAAGSGAEGSGGGGAFTPRCAASLTADSRALVGDAIDLLFVEEDIAAVELYFEDPYLQHNPIAESGTAALASVMAPIISSPSFSYERIRTFADCDLVVVQGQYSGSGVVFDLFRVDEGQIVEHWDSDAGRASPALGSAPLADEDLTEENRALVEELLAGLVSRRAAAELLEFFGEELISHRTPDATGASAFLDRSSADGVGYTAVHRIVADGNHVFALSEGAIGDSAYALYDLFRVEGGVIVEHWDSSRAVPASTASGLPIF